MKRCMCCFNPAVYESGNTSMRLCEDCYLDMSDTFAGAMEDECGMSFEDYYDISEVSSESGEG